MVLYLSLIASFFQPHAWLISIVSLLWYFAGSLLQSEKSLLSTVLAAAGALLESIFQLLVNTISFVRVGAFALAHGGLISLLKNNRPLPIELLRLNRVEMADCHWHSSPWPIRLTAWLPVS